MIGLGFQSTETSRLMSRQLDNKGVDLVETGPIHIQAKYVKGTVAYRDCLERMPKDKFRTVFHGRPRKRIVVAIELEEWLQLACPPNFCETMCGKNIKDPWKILKEAPCYVHRHPEKKELIFMHYEEFKPALQQWLATEEK